MRDACEDILGYEVDSRPVEQCLADVSDWVVNGQELRWLACINPHSYVVALKDKVASAALHDADWLVPDGIGIVLASRILAGRIRHRVTGSDVFLELQARLNHLGGHSVFLLGSTEPTLSEMGLRMARQFPNVKLAGTYSPPFKPTYDDDDLAKMLAPIRETRPDVLWVGMTAPKQEKWIYQNRGSLPVKFAAAVGAVFDFYAGTVKRSHPTFQEAGLEWLPRLLREPRRLWRRMLVSAPIFLIHVLQARIHTASTSSGHRTRGR